jgi:hypothetical protein
MLNAPERKWVARLQKVLRDHPSERLGFYTIGDADVTLYDRDKEGAIQAEMAEKGCDFCTAVDNLDARLGTLIFPAIVHSTAG